MKLDVFVQCLVLTKILCALGEESYERCRETHRCPLTYSTYSVQNRSVNFASSAFKRGKQNAASLFADFEDWKQGTYGWQSTLDHSSNASWFRGFSSFGHSVMNETIIAPNSTIRFNTTDASYSIDNDSSISAEFRFTEDRHIRVATFNFLSLQIYGKVEIVGINPLALVSRSSMKIDTGLPSLPGGYPASEKVSFYNAWKRGTRFYLFTIHVGVSEREVEVQMIQTFAAEGNNIHGKFSLGFKGINTRLISVTATRQQMQVALGEMASVLGKVRVATTGIPSNAGFTWYITFLTYIGNPPQLQLARDNTYGVEAGVRITTLHEGHNIEGSFRLKLFDQWVGSIQHNASAKEVENVIAYSDTSVQRSIGVDEEARCSNGLCTNFVGPEGDLLWSIRIQTEEDLYTPNQSYISPETLNSVPLSPRFRFTDIKVDSNFTNNKTFVEILPGHVFPHADSFQDVESKVIADFEESLTEYRNFFTDMIKLDTYNASFLDLNTTMESILNASIISGKLYSFVASYMGEYRQTEKCKNPFEAGSGEGFQKDTPLHEILRYPFFRGERSPGNGAILFYAENDISFGPEFSLNSSNGKVLMRAGASVEMSEEVISSQHRSFFVEAQSFPLNTTILLRDSICHDISTGWDFNFHIHTSFPGPFEEAKNVLKVSSFQRMITKDLILKTKPKLNLGIQRPFIEDSRPTRINFYLYIDSDVFEGTYHTISILRFSLTSYDRDIINSTIENGVLLFGNESVALFPADCWHQIELRLDWQTGQVILRLNRAEVMLNGTFDTSFNATRVVFWVHNGATFYLDEIFVGIDEGVFFTCPEIISETMLMHRVNTMQHKLDAMLFQDEYYDRKANNPDDFPPFWPKEHHYHHVLNREVYKYPNETGILVNSGPETPFMYDPSNLSKSPLKTDLFKTTHSGQYFKVSTGPPKYLWIQSVVHYFLNESILNDTSEWHRVGGVVSCSTSDKRSFRNEGMLLNYINLSYTGGVPRSEMRLNTASNESNQGSTVHIRHQVMEKVNTWNHTLLNAKSPRILNNGTQFLLWVSVQDALHQISLGEETIELGVAGVAIGSDIFGLFRFHDSFLPNRNISFDHTVFKKYFIMSYYATVDYILPEPVLQPIWQEVLNELNETDFGLTYHRAYYHPDYDDINDICSQRMRKEDRPYQKLVRHNTTDPRLPYKEMYTPNSTFFNITWSKIEYPGLGEIPARSRFKDPRVASNNAFLPGSVDAVKSQPWYNNYMDGNVADNPIHPTLPDKLIGLPRVVLKRKSKYLAVCLLDSSLTKIDKILKIVEGTISRKKEEPEHTDHQDFAHQLREGVAHDIEEVLNYDNIFHNYGAYLKGLRESIPGYLEEHQARESDTHPEPEVSELFFDIESESQGSPNPFDIIFGDLTQLEALSAPDLSNLNNTEILEVLVNATREAFAAGALPYEKSYFPNICSKSLQDQNETSFEPSDKMLRNKLHPCNEIKAPTSISTDPGQIWSNSGSKPYRTEADYIHRYHQYFIHFNDREDDVVNYFDQVTQSANKSNLGRQPIREYDHNCLRGPNEIPEGVPGHIPADNAYMSPLSPYYLKTPGANVNETTDHLLDW